MGGRQGRTRELQNKKSATHNDLHPKTDQSIEDFRDGIERALIKFKQLENTPYQKVVALIPTNYIKNLCNRYWIDYDFHNSPLIAEVKPYAIQLSAALSRLIELVDAGDAFKNDAIEILSREVGLDTEQRLDLLDIWKDGCDEIINTPSKTGRRLSNYLDDTTRRLSQLWSEISGLPFSKNFAPLIPKGGEFDAKNCQFVLEMCKAIDPRITFSEVQTSLRRNARHDL